MKARNYRKVYVNLPYMKCGKAKITWNGVDWLVSEGYGAFVSNVDEGDEPFFESIGEQEAEVVDLDANPN